MYTDQTPTPTKFLRYGEEIGLFNELTKNPFDEAFKSAAENVFKGKVSTPTAEVSIDWVMHSLTSNNHYRIFDY